MGGSNLPQAFPNYLISLRFIRISTVAFPYNGLEAPYRQAPFHLWKPYCISFELISSSLQIIVALHLVTLHLKVLSSIIVHL